MQGYTCVRFADICRLCATNCISERVGIFDEQGRSLNLENKMTKLVDIKVSPHDNLPKVICGKCVLKLEEAQNLWNIAQSSEVMLNNFYERAQNFSHFKNTGMVYVQNNELQTIPNGGVGRDKSVMSVRRLDNQQMGIQNAPNMHNVKIIRMQGIRKAEELPKQQALFKILNKEAVPKLIHSNLNADPTKDANKGMNEVTKNLIIQAYNSEVVAEASNCEDVKPSPLSAFAAPAMRNDMAATVEGESECKSSECTSVLGTKVPNCYSHTNGVDIQVVRKYVCNECGKRFRRREHLFQHAKLHAGVRPWKCRTCDKAFIRKEHLSRHEILHTGQKDYTCHLCAKSFARHDNLLKHRKIHDNHQKYTCEICLKVFILKRYYEQHMRTVHEQKPKIEKIKIIQDIECAQQA